MQCKNCSENKIVKNGNVRGKQRFKCQTCGYNFVEGDGRVKHETLIKRAFAVILYALGKASYGFIAKLFGVTRAAVFKWLKKEAALMEKPKISAEIRNIEFDEMWHFIQSKKTKNGSSKQWIVIEGELLHGLSAIVMLKPSEDCMIKSSI
jgi:transposase-like protein